MPEIAKVRYTHDACIDKILACPDISQNDLAAEFGYSATWISTIVNSDAFQARLAERKKELIDPVIALAMEERLKGLASRSIEILMKRMEADDAPHSAAVAIKALPIAISGLGMGQKRESGPVANLYIVQAPPPAPDSASWLKGRTLEHGE
jgi:hypothetical protein